MESRGKSRRRNPYQIWKRRASAMLAVLLTLSLILGDVRGLSGTVMAGQGTVKEEFRMHREDILKAAEEAIENGEALWEPLEIAGEEQKTENQYRELLPADGSVYEIFPEIEQVRDVDSLELRVFICLEEGADPASYTLTGEEKLVFLYVNGGDMAAEGRVNIDGYVSEFTRVDALKEEGPAQAAGNAGGAAGPGAGGAAGESETVSGEELAPEDSLSDLTEAPETEGESPAEADGAAPEETLPVETQETEEAAAEETTVPVEETEEAAAEETAAPVQETEETAAEETTAPAQETEEAAAEEMTAPVQETTDGAAESSAAESSAAAESAEDDTAKPEPAESSAAEESKEDAADRQETAETEGNEPAGETVGEEKEEVETEAEETAAEETAEETAVVSMSLRSIQKVTASLASASEAESAAEEEEEVSYYEDTGDPFDKEDEAALTEEEDLFREKAKFGGRKYDEVILNETLMVRAFAVQMEDAGFDREEILEGAHHITYTVTEGEARLACTPEYVRDEATVTFGIIPEEGMVVYQVTSNGTELAETEISPFLASASQARKASSSEAEPDTDRMVYYQIPDVLEDQDVQIRIVEEGYNDHPAFLQSRTVNGVTVTVSAEEGILPAGTELQVEEVTEQVADAVTEKIEAEASEEEPVHVTSVLAYDINLMLEGKKLANSYWEGNSVSVIFSGDRIEETTKEADQAQIFTVETPTETVEAALGDTEEIPVVENITAEDIKVESEGREPIRVAGSESVRDITIEAEHFTVYAYVVTGSVPKAYDFNGYAYFYSPDDSGSYTINDKKYKQALNGTGLNVTFIATGNGNECVVKPEGITYYDAVYYRPNNWSKYTKVSGFTMYNGQIYATLVEGRTVQYTGHSQSFYWLVEDDVWVNAKVYVRYDGIILQENINSSQGIGDYGPSGNNKPYMLIDINLSEVLNDADVSIQSNSYETYGKAQYISAKNKYTSWTDRDAYKTDVNNFYTEYIKPNIKANDRNELLNLLGPEFYGYVLKSENDGWHLDGYIDSTYLLEVYYKNEGTTDPVYTEGSDKPLYYSTVTDAIKDYLDVEDIQWENIRDTGKGPQIGYYTKDGIGYQVTVTFGLKGYDTSVNMSDQKINYHSFNSGQTHLAVFVFEVQQTKFTVPDQPFIRVTKTFEKESGNALEEAEISEIQENGFTITVNESTKLMLENISEGNSGKYLWNVYGAQKESYSITEENVELDGYEVSAKFNETSGSEGNFQGIVSAKSSTISFEPEAYENVIPQGTNVIAGKLETDEYVIWTNEQLSINEREAILTSLVTRWHNISTANSSFYSGKILENGLTYQTSDGNNYTITLKEGQIILSHGNVWKEFVYGTYEEIIVPEIEIVNTYTQCSINFAIYKTLVGGSSGDNVNKVSFQLYKWEVDEGSGRYVAYGGPVFVTAEESEGLLTEGYAFFDNIPEGEYELVEVTTSPGYILHDPIYLKVENEYGNLVLMKQDGENWENISIPEGKNCFTFDVLNYPGAELPETGGPGYIMAERFGWLLLLLALAGVEVQMFGRKRRREEQ